jgi:hypothetical protein
MATKPFKLIASVALVSIVVNHSWSAMVSQQSGVKLNPEPLDTKARKKIKLPLDNFLNTKSLADIIVAGKFYIGTDNSPSTTELLNGVAINVYDTTCGSILPITSPVYSNFNWNYGSLSYANHRVIGNPILINGTSLAFIMNTWTTRGTVPISSNGCISIQVANDAGWLSNTVNISIDCSAGNSCVATDLTPLELNFTTAPPTLPTLINGGQCNAGPGAILGANLLSVTNPEGTTGVVMWKAAAATAADCLTPGYQASGVPASFFVNGLVTNITNNIILCGEIFAIGATCVTSSDTTCFAICTDDQSATYAGLASSTCTNAIFTPVGNPAAG